MKRSAFNILYTIYQVHVLDVINVNEKKDDYKNVSKYVISLQ